MIRLATIGTSTITEKFADAVAQTPGIRIDVVFSRDADRGRAFADRLGIDRVSTDLDALLSTGEVDAVYVGSPNGAHAAQAAAAIAAGVHVFLEKPATPTADEFARLVDDARDRGVVVFEGMRNVYDPGMSRLRELLPRVGAVRLVSFGQSQRSARYDLVLAGETPNIFDPALAGGALFDLGVYPLSAAIELFGAPSRVLGATVAPSSRSFRFRRRMPRGSSPGARRSPAPDDRMQQRGFRGWIASSGRGESHAAQAGRP